VPNLLRDARFGLRLFRKNPSFVAVAVLTLALGIAANTAIFSLVYATFLAPLPYRDPDRLVMVFSRLGGNRALADAGDFVEWKRRATVFEDLNAWTLRSVNLATGDRPEHVGPFSSRRASCRWSVRNARSRWAAPSWTRKARWA